MNDNILFVVASATAVIGLTILWFTAPPEQDGYQLTGVVVAKRGSTATVLTNVTVVIRNVTVGASINRSVFWADNRFIAPNP